VFAGNRSDVTTVEEIVKAMEEKYGRANRIWVMDRGMVSEENLAFLRARDGQYLVGTPKAMLRQFEGYLTEKDWHEVQEGVEVKLVGGPEGDETFILARSADRREKEKAMHERFVERLEEALGKMRSAAECGRLKDEAVANRRLGRLLGQYWRAAGAFEVKIERLSPPQGKQRLRVTWTPRTNWKSAPSGIRRRTASWPTSWSASWPTSYGRPWRNGCGDRAWATRRGRSWKSWPRSRVATSSCPPRPSRATTTARSGCAASPSRTRPKRPCSIGSGSPCPDAFAASMRLYQCSGTDGPKMNVSPEVDPFV